MSKQNAAKNFMVVADVADAIRLRLESEHVCPYLPEEAPVELEPEIQPEIGELVDKINMEALSLDLFGEELGKQLYLEVTGGVLAKPQNVVCMLSNSETAGTPNPCSTEAARSPLALNTADFLTNRTFNRRYRRSPSQALPFLRRCKLRRAPGASKKYFPHLHLRQLNHRASVATIFVKPNARSHHRGGTSPRLGLPPLCHRLQVELIVWLITPSCSPTEKKPAMICCSVFNITCDAYWWSTRRSTQRMPSRKS